MNEHLFASARELSERAKRHNQTGTVADADELELLARDLGTSLPDWYRVLLATVPLVGLELGVPVKDSDPDDMNWVVWLGPAAIRSESLELYPGLAVLSHGYLCVGGCAHGSGDQYFIKASAGDDPPLFQIAHDISSDADLILASGLIAVAPSLSGFFASAITVFP